MTADDVRQVLWVRAWEEALPASPGGAASHGRWTATDGAWASAQASHRSGAEATAERWVAQRAELARQRLGDAAALPPDRTAAAWPVAAALLAALAFALGVAGGSIGPDRRIDLLVPPLMALLGWNGTVYLVLVGHALWRLVRRPQATGAQARFRALRPALVAAWQGLSERAPGASAPQRRFAALWAAAALPMQAARVATALHLAAAALAAGAMAGLYLRGLVFAYQAGWDSTFLDAPAVHAWLHALLGPASWASGIALPDVAGLEALRLDRGPGENAARWIHLYAITVAGAVILPRMALAAVAGWRARRLAAALPLPLEEPYFRQLLRARAATQGGPALETLLLPYAFQGGANEALRSARQTALAEALGEAFGAPVQLRWAAPVPLGGEDELATHWPMPSPDDRASGAVALLFSSTATPERETHAAFVAAAAARCAAARPPQRCVVLVDESAFRARFAGATLDTRVAERRAAWLATLRGLGPEVRFVP